mmetsp:Transcript_9771/g.14289  ORF Transcript_9771/g.14289 Transcript_9771/m.14289 type:complete len:200 (-) Transcript_9771:170-769(-)
MLKRRILSLAKSQSISKSGRLPFSSKSSSSSTSWERSARAVKNTDVTNKYLEEIRDVYADPSSHIKTIEDELRGAMGQALGRQAEKILQHSRSMEKEYQTYKALLDSATSSDVELYESAIRYNEHREKAKTARWELIVHRQAVGFLVDNHRVVHEKFPISDALPESKADQEAKEELKESNKKKKFGDQLDWWQKIGRWR